MTGADAEPTLPAGAEPESGADAEPKPDDGPELTADANPLQPAGPQAAGESSPGEKVDRAVLFVALVALTAGFGYLAKQSVGFPDSNAAVVVLMWTFTLAALVSLAAATGVLTKSWRGIVPTTFVLVALVTAVSTLAYFVLYDVVLTPEKQLIWDEVCVVAAVLLLGLSLSPFRRWKAHSTTKQLVALLATVPLVTLFGAWYTYIYGPVHTRPVVVVTVDLKSGPVIAASGTSPRMVPVVGGISVENTGSVDAGITASMLKVVETPLGGGVLADPPTETLSSAVTSTGALEPFGDDVKQLSTLVATSDPAADVAYLDELTPSGTFIEPGETLHRSFATAVPDPAEPVVLTLKVEVFLINEDVREFRTCDRTQSPTDGLQMQPSGASAGGEYACFQARIPFRTPIGKLFFDNPDIETFFVVDDRQVPGSATGEMFQSFSKNGADIVGDQSAIDDAFQKLRKFSAAIMTQSETQIVVP